jgi:uncharacterized membrane protein YhaH (DUF805 family)
MSSHEAEPMSSHEAEPMSSHEADMSFTEAIRSGFSNYAVFFGRATRSEYWYWVLFAMLGGLATVIIDSAIFASHSSVSPLNSLFNLAIFLPGLGLAVRRLHDIDRSGWWILITLTLIGVFLLIYWACQSGTPGPNRFGADPFASGNLSPRR